MANNSGNATISGAFRFENKNNVEERYSLKIKKINRLLENLNEIGIDTSSFKKRLNEITTLANSELKSLVESDRIGITYAELSGNIYYKYNYDLDKILEELKKYDSLVSSYYKSQSIGCELSKEKEFDELKINNLVDLILSALCEINSLELANYSTIKDTVESIYEIAYKVMKLEFRYFSSSRVFEYAKLNETTKEYMNGFIETDLERFNKTNVLNNSIKKMISDIKSEGIDYDYLNEALIVYLSMDDEFVTSLQSNLDNLLETIEKNKKNIEDYNHEVESSKEKYEPYKRKIRSNSIKSFIFALITAASLYGASKASTALADVRYNASIETYSSLDDEKKSLNLYQDKSSSSSTYTVYSPYSKLEDGRYSRMVERYDISGINYDDILKYLDVNYDVLKPFVYYDYKDELEEEDKYTEDYCEIYIRDVDKNDYQITHKVGFAIGKVFSWLLTIFLILVLDVGVTHDNGGNSIFDIIDNIIEDLKDSKDIKEKIKEYERLAAAEKKLLDNNEELKEKFIKKYGMLFEREKGLKLEKKN